jgi:hypothetical protein
MFAAQDMLLGQSSMNPPHTIRPAAVSMNGLDVLAQHAVGALSTAFWTFSPSIVAALADL